ncbi:MAG: nuclear transport factor 2 family protein [Verrucomicrobiales bacterium]|nr:nuclear transport factor 2 family protein [Verrucomicrobiales bacterium]
MKSLLSLLAITLLGSLPAFGQSPDASKALAAADDARIAAILKADTAALTGMLSDDLHYAHSSGAVDSKAVFLSNLQSGGIRYTGYQPQERKFTFPAPGIALMTGRAHIQAETAKGKMDSILSYLAVWREENGQWRFLAWQSCRLPTETPKP